MVVEVSEQLEHLSHIKSLPCTSSLTWSRSTCKDRVLLFFLNGVFCRNFMLCLLKVKVVVDFFLCESQSCKYSDIYGDLQRGSSSSPPPLSPVCRRLLRPKLRTLCGAWGGKVVVPGGKGGDRLFLLAKDDPV